MSRLRYLTAGESHGKELTGILDGMPAGLSLIAERDIDPWIAERQKGYGRGRRQQIESDRAEITSGVRFGVTTGAPIALRVENRDWKNWKHRMSVTPNDGAEVRSVTIPRPGHADLAGAIKYGHEADIRNVLERASARETAIRVAIGAVAATLLRELGIESIAYVRSIGSVEGVIPEDVFLHRDALSASEVRMFDVSSSKRAMHKIDSAREAGDTLGGVVECVVRGLPIGVGSHTQWDRKLDAALANAVMSIQAVKGVEIGAGFEAARRKGSEVHDAFHFANALERASNNAGGIEGGMSNGEPIVIRAAMKPISTLMQPLGSIDLSTGEAAEAHIERSDVCAVPSLAVIVEAVTCLTIADALLDTFGGDTLDELHARITARRDRAPRPKEAAR